MTLVAIEDASYQVKCTIENIIDVSVQVTSDLDQVINDM